MTFKIINCWVLGRYVISLLDNVGLNYVGARASHDQPIDRIGPLQPLSPSKNQRGVLPVTWPLILFMDFSATRFPFAGIMGRHPQQTGSLIVDGLPLCRCSVGLFYSPSRVTLEM